MPWKECHVVDERLRFVARLLDGEKMAAALRGVRDLAQDRLQDLRALQRHRRARAHAIAAGGRYRHANQLPLAIEKLIVRLKKEYPSWGAPKIRERLRQRWPDVACPAISTVHAVLDRHGLVAPAPAAPPATDRHAAVPAGRSRTPCGAPTTRASFCSPIGATAIR